MQKWLAEVRVTLKPVVNDPPGIAIRESLRNLGYNSIAQVRSGKYLQLYLSADNQDSAAQLVTDMCRRLLANPVIEDYDFDLEQVEFFPK